ncbi:MAG TPA: F0F1 ATP synthase subunit A [Levilinea sp.]|nr:F0F1 ATP synthase subunit A [Levilinea sp.]
MQISPDSLIFFEWGFVKLNATIVFTWLIMALLVITSWLVTRRLKMGEGEISRGQNILEMIVIGICSQIRAVSRHAPEPFLPFIGTTFLFIVTSNTLSAVPAFQPPTGSLSTTAAIAICVFFAVPIYGIADRGVVDYFKQYLAPNPIMLPFNIIGELSRTMALAVRLFGNVMSGVMIGAILLSLVPLFIPVIMQLMGLLIGVIQAYIFTVLAMVFISSAMRTHEEKLAALERAGKISSSH